MKSQGKVSYRGLERVIKGFANYRRLQMLFLISEKPNLSIDEIAARMKLGYMNTSDHLRRMLLAGLLIKKNEGVTAHYQLSQRGIDILVFCKKLK